jgi:NAD-dependent DNA ligase
MNNDRFLEKSATNILTAINSRKEIYDWELLGSLSFKDVGRKTSKLFLREMTLDEVLKNFNTKTGRIIDITLEEELIKIKGIERITARNIIKGIENNYSIIKELNKELTIKSLKEELFMNSSKDSKKIVFTGFRDRVIQDILENKGHSVASSVSKNTDIVVAKDAGNLTTKLSKALELGIPIYNIDDFKNKILPSLIK